MRAPFRVIDADGHMGDWAPAFAERMPKKYQGVAPRRYSGDGGGSYWICEGKVWPEYKDKDRGGTPGFAPPNRWVGREGEYDVHKRMPDMDYMGIDVSVLFPASMMGVITIVEDPGLAAASARAYNDWLAQEYCGPYPDRLKGAAMVPVQDPKEAAKELYRAVGELGLVATNVIPHFGTKMLDNKELFPIYEAAQELGVPICVHNNSAISPARHHMENFVLRHGLNSVSSMMGLGSVVIGGVADAFPDLKFAFLEAGGGWVPYVMERLERRFHALPHWVSHLKRSPAEQMRSEQMFYSVEPDELTVPMVAQLLGEEHLVMGSDYSHFDGTAPESVRMVLERTDISDELKRKILSDNPARLYNL